MTMKIIALTIAAAGLLASTAGAAPLNPAAIASSLASSVDQVRLDCNEEGHC
jgi:hypothetical protein